MALVICGPLSPDIDWTGRGVDDAVILSDLPERDEIRAALRDVGPDGVVVTGSTTTLHHVVEGLHRLGQVAETPIGYVPGDLPQPFVSPVLTDQIDRASNGTPREMVLVRDEGGGVVLVEASIRAAAARTLGAQAYHDDQRICDGPIRSITVTPDYAADDPTLDVVLRPTGLRRRRSSRGRSIQIACDEAITVVDGITSARTLTKRTWYGDRRTHWLLRS